jgi:hypothetical protein
VTEDGAALDRGAGEGEEGGETGVDATTDATQGAGEGGSGEDATAVRPPLDATADSPSRVDATAPDASGGGRSLLGFIKTLGANAGGVLVGQTLDLYSSTPLDDLSTNRGASFPSVSVGAPGPSTGKLPAIIDLFVDNDYNDESTNAPPNDFVSLANGALSAGAIVKVNCEPPNPATGQFSTKTFPADVLTSGSADNKAYLARLATDAAMLKRIEGPFLFCLMGEMNLGGYWSDIQSGATEAQFVELWQLTYKYLVGTEGLTRMLWAYETNDGVGNYTWGFPGTSYVDLVGIDSFLMGGALGQSDKTAYNEVSAYGLPFFFSSTGLSTDPGSLAAFSGNNFTGVANVITSDFPSAFGAVFWCQTDALSNQNGAAQCLGTAPWLGADKLPKFTSGGGVGGG